jgi:hypothetical protein
VSLYKIPNGKGSMDVFFISLAFIGVSLAGGLYYAPRYIENAPFEIAIFLKWVFSNVILSRTGFQNPYGRI